MIVTLMISLVGSLKRIFAFIYRTNRKISSWHLYYQQSNAILLACDGGGHLVLAYELVDHVADFITSIVIDLADDNLRQQAVNESNRLCTEKLSDTSRLVLM